MVSIVTNYFVTRSALVSPFTRAGGRAKYKRRPKAAFQMVTAVRRRGGLLDLRFAAQIGQHFFEAAALQYLEDARFGFIHRR